MNLDLFKSAQTRAYSQALAELGAGKKTGCWIWYVFPQLAGIAANPSPTTQTYSIPDLDSACEYLNDELLFHRYAEITAVVKKKVTDEKIPVQVLMGKDVDVSKLRSSLTLFLHAAVQLANTEQNQAKLERLKALISDCRIMTEHIGTCQNTEKTLKIHTCKAQASDASTARYRPSAGRLSSATHHPATPAPRRPTTPPSHFPSMQILGAFIAATGITAVAIAFTVLNAATLGIPGLIVGVIGIASVLVGCGIFAKGMVDSSQPASGPPRSSR